MMLTLLLPTVLAVVAQDDAKPASILPSVRAVPKDALFLVQVRGLDALRADFEKSAWYAFWQDEEMNPIRTWVESKMDEEVEEENDLGFEPWTFLASVHGSITAFGVDQPEETEPLLGLVIDPGEPRGAFEEVFDRFLERRKRDGIVSSAEYEGVEIVLVEDAPEEDADGEASGGGEGDHGSPELGHSAIFDTGTWCGVVVAGSPDAVLEQVHGMIDRAGGRDTAGGIEANETLAEARGSVSSSGRIEAFVDLGRLIELARREDPPEEEQERLLQALDVDGLRWLYACADVGKGEELGLDLAIRLPDGGYLRDWAGLLGALPKELAGMMPRESSSISLGRIDIWGLWQSAWSLFREIEPDGAEAARLQLDTAAQQMGGFDVEKEFLAQLDGSFGTFQVDVPKEEWGGAFDMGLEGDAGVDPPSGGSATVIGVRDPKVVSGFVEKVLTGVGIFPQVETEEFQGNTIYKLESGMGPGAHWTFLKKTAVFSQFPTALRAAMRMEGAEAKESALEKESFKPLIASHPEASFLGLASTAESLKTGLTMAEMIGGVTMSMASPQGGPGEGLADNPLERLPEPAVIERYFKGTLVTSLVRKGSVLRFRMGSR